MTSGFKHTLFAIRN